jgi:hypothetical protein
VSTPDKFLPDFCKLAQSSGECPGERSILPLALGVVAVGRPVGGRPRLPLEAGGPRFGIGPRFGRGPVEGTRIDCEDVGSARRFEGATRGGGIRDEVAGFIGGAMRFDFGGGAVANVGGRDALWAELRAGKDGGGRLSSSSSSSELWWVSSVKVGMGGASGVRCGSAFGVVCGDASKEGVPFVSCVFRSCNSGCCCSSGMLCSCSPLCDLSGVARAAPSFSWKYREGHVDHGW